MKPAEELFRCTYSMCDVFYWRDMVDFAETYASQSIIGKNTNKDSLSVNEPKELSSILTNKLDKPTVNWDEIRRIMSNYWDMDHPEANDFVNELTESLNAQLAAGEEEIAKAIEAYNSPLSIRSREEYVKWRDGLAKIITSLHPQPDAQQRYVELIHECRLQLEYLNEKFGETGTTNSVLSRIAAGLKEE